MKYDFDAAGNVERKTSGTMNSDGRRLGDDLDYQHAIDDYEGNIENNIRSLPTEKYPNKAEEIAVRFENLLRGAYWKNRPEKLRPGY